DRLLVVLDDVDGIALHRQRADRVEQQTVVARMKTDRRLVEDVADAPQIRAELRREPDALRFAAGERRRAAIERQITETDAIEKLEAADELGQHVARDLALSALELQTPQIVERLANRVGAEIRDRVTAEIDGQRRRVQTPPLALGADVVGAVEPAGAVAGGAAPALHAARGRAPRRLGEPRLVAHVVVRRRREPRAVARFAPAVPRVVREHARVERLEAPPAARAGALGRVKLPRHAVTATARRASPRRDDAHHAAPKPKRRSNGLLELRVGR